ncbi:hypothetical protein V8E54_014079 [Elaphomyces granulatus]
MILNMSPLGGSLHRKGWKITVIYVNYGFFGHLNRIFGFLQPNRLTVLFESPLAYHNLVTYLAGNMGRRMHTVVWSHFTTLMAPDGKTCKEVKCRHCDWKAAQNTCRMAQHLEKCVVYQSRIAEEKGGPTQQKLNLKQQPLRVRSISKEEQEKLEEKAGYAIYCGARPFSMFMEPYMKDFILNLEPAFEVPSNRTFATTVLDLCYEETRAEVFDVLRRSHFLNVSLDESSNIKRDRIINICILTNFGPFCLRYELVGVGTSSAERIAEWLVKQLEILEKDIGQKLPRINSLTTDTCSTMRSLWELLRTYDRFKYALFVPCDSHGLQLLIKDIISHNVG